MKLAHNKAHLPNDPLVNTVSLQGSAIKHPRIVRVFLCPFKRNTNLFAIFSIRNKMIENSGFNMGEGRFE
jgi:hypothetical protein